MNAETKFMYNIVYYFLQTVADSWTAWNWTSIFLESHLRICRSSACALHIDS